MTQISSMTGPISSLRAQLRAQAETALAPEVNNTPFTLFLSLLKMVPRARGTILKMLKNSKDNISSIEPSSGARLNSTRVS